MRPWLVESGVFLDLEGGFWYDTVAPFRTHNVLLTLQYRYTSHTRNSLSLISSSMSAGSNQFQASYSPDFPPFWLITFPIGLGL